MFKIVEYSMHCRNLYYQDRKTLFCSSSRTSIFSMKFIDNAVSNFPFGGCDGAQPSNFRNKGLFSG